MTNIKTKPYYESRLYIGSVKHTGEEFGQQVLEKAISNIQDNYKYVIPVRITPTTFISGSEYREYGWEVCAINYPKIETNSIDIDDFMRHLAIKLSKEFKQHTICVMDFRQITMYEGQRWKE